MANASSGELAVDTRTTRLCVFQRLDDKNGSAFGEHKAVPVDIPWSRCPLRLVVAAAHGLHLGEAGDRQRVDNALGASHDGNIGAAQP